MRVDLKKAIFLGPLKIKEYFFEHAQKLGLIDFIERKGKKKGKISDQVLEVVSAIKILRTLNPVVQYDSVSKAKAQEVVKRINETHHHLEELQAEQANLEERIHIVAPFGSFSISKIRQLEEEAKFKYQFFAAKKSAHLDFPEDLRLFKVGEQEELNFYVSLGQYKFISPKIIDIDVTASAEDLKEIYEVNRGKIRELEQILKECSHYNEAIHLLFLDVVNSNNLDQAQERTEELLEENVFMTTGWVPVNKLEEVKDFCHSKGVLFKEIKIENHEFVPTNLENTGLNRVGEDLVHIYDTPSATDVDPSIWVLIFFCLFFAIIVGDAGYGLIYLLICAYLWWKHPKITGFKKRVLKLSTILSACCIGWGILAGSYFGIPLNHNNPLKKYSLIQWMVVKKAEYHIDQKDDVWKKWVEEYPNLATVKDPWVFLDTAVKEHGGTEHYEVVNRYTDNIMLELALFIGVLHLIFSMARYALRHWALFGWIIFMVGAYLYVSAEFNYTSIVNFIFGIPKPLAHTLGKELSIVGLVIAVVAALIQERWYGLLEIAKLIQILSDVLSYLRLYALGMAGGILAATINGFAASTPLIVGILIAFLAHTFNMALGIMGGVIHGLRLNFLEWYHYSFYGGGKEFKPLRILTKDE